MVDFHPARFWGSLNPYHADHNLGTVRNVGKENRKVKKEQAYKPVLMWEMLNTTREEDGLLNSKYIAERAKVPGGWLVISQFNIGGAHGLVFLPDPNHAWDGGSLQ